MTTRDLCQQYALLIGSLRGQIQRLVTVYEEVNDDVPLFELQELLKAANKSLEEISKTLHEE